MKFRHVTPEPDGNSAIVLLAAPQTVTVHFAPFPDASTLSSTTSTSLTHVASPLAVTCLSSPTLTTLAVTSTTLEWFFETATRGFTISANFRGECTYFDGKHWNSISIGRMARTVVGLSSSNTRSFVEAGALRLPNSSFFESVHSLRRRCTVLERVRHCAHDVLHRVL